MSRRHRRHRRIGHLENQAGYTPVSPYMDARLYQYAIHLIQSPFLNSHTEKVFDFILSLLGDSLLEDLLTSKLEQSPNAMELFDPDVDRLLDYDDMKILLGRKGITSLFRNKIVPLLKSRGKEFGRKALEDSKVEQLRQAFRLNSVEVEILSYLYIIEATPPGKLLADVGDFDERALFARGVGQILGCSTQQILKAMSTGNLFKSGLAQKEPLCLEDWVMDFLTGIKKGFDETFFIRFRGECLNLKDHLVDPRELQILTEFLAMRRPANILLYGKPGTGKTELVKSVADHLKKELYIINNKENQSCRSLKSAVIATCNTLDPHTSIILVDEADDLLQTESSFMFNGENNSKSWINNFLDNSRHKILWITNRTWGIEESTLRRFGFSMKFKKFTLKKKLQVFRYCLEKGGLGHFFGHDDLVRLCSRYSINAGAIADALKNLRIRKNSKKQVVLEKLETVLKNHQMAITGEDFKVNRLKELDRYNPKILNTSENMERVISAVGRFMARLDECSERRKGSMNLLLYGAPGSGKTEFVKYLGKSLNKEILFKRASDLTSCWVGETEKKLAEVFDEAEGGQSILFLDEADSFLRPRENTMHSWEVTQVNELLTHMENFNGVLVCATNFLKGLDQAALRRFKFKIEFLPLKPEGVGELYRTLLFPLAGGMPLTRDQEERLRSILSLTPGDFHVLVEKYRYWEDTPCHDDLILQLEKETRHKNKERQIGFAA